MAYRCCLIGCVLLIGLAGAAGAQEEPGGAQLRYIEEIKQRNADYGPGCNGVGVSVPAAVELPTELTSDWAAAHSACIPGMRLIMTCLSEVVGAERVIGCTTLVADGETDMVAACEHFTLVAPDERFRPDPELSDMLGQGSDDVAQSCAESVPYAPDAAIATAFVVPAGEPTPDVVVLIDINGAEVPAFVIPGSQLDSAGTTDS